MSKEFTISDDAAYELEDCRRIMWTVNDEHPDNSALIKMLCRAFKKACRL